MSEWWAGLQKPLRLHEILTELITCSEVFTEGGPDRTTFINGFASDGAVSKAGGSAQGTLCVSLEPS